MAVWDASCPQEVEVELQDAGGETFCYMTVYMDERLGDVIQHALGGCGGNFRLLSIRMRMEESAEQVPPATALEAKKAKKTTKALEAKKAKKTMKAKKAIKAGRFLKGMRAMRARRP